LGQWPLIGLHNIQNLAFALAAARWMGAEKDRLEEALSGFKAPEHRLQEIGQVCGITFIDDSKATNVAATKSAISSLEREVILIAGGSYKAEEFHPLSELVCSGGKDWGIKGAVLIGQEAARINEVLSPLVETCLIKTNGDRDGQGLSIMKEAVARAFEMARPGQSILLSPACASFDLFSGYKERAEAFRQAFRELKLQKEGGGGRQGQDSPARQEIDGQQGA
jgi:UDP-N-acetylmuramoylalanine--D-glutamate ligase